MQRLITDKKAYRQLKAKKVLYRLSRIVWSVFRAALLVGLGFVILYPLIYSVALAFRPSEQVYDPTVKWLSKSLTLENLKNAISLMKYPEALVTSLRINVISSLLQVAACAMTGYGFARFNFRWKKLLFFLVLLTVLVPPQVIITPSFLTFRTLGLVNNPLAFYLPALLGSGLKGGLFIFIFRQFFRGLPKELEEAAAIDGCGFMHCFLRIVIPNAGAVFLMAVILSFIWYWNDYYMGSMYMRNVNTVTLALDRLPAASQSMTGDIAYDPFKVVTLMQAGSLLTILPPLLAYLFLQRKFVQGVQRSGIVG